MFLVKGRLRNGVGVAQAQAAMDILGRRLAADYPNDDPGRGIKVIASKDIWIHPQLDAPINATAFIVLAIVGLVFAIACSNLATLLLVRGASRARDISIRLAIGATRRQLVRQLLTESLLLAGLGGAAGCVLAWWGIRWFRTVDLPIVIDISIDGRVLAYAIALSVLTGIACGLAPALSATNVDVLPALRGDGADAVTPPAGQYRDAADLTGGIQAPGANWVTVQECEHVKAARILAVPLVRLGDLLLLNEDRAPDCL